MTILREERERGNMHRGSVERKTISDENEVISGRREEEGSSQMYPAEEA